MPIGKSVFSLARMAGGAAIGGAIGGLASDSNDATGRFQSALQGAAVGMGIGALTTRAARSLTWRGLKKVPGMGWRAGKGLTGAAVRAGRYTLRHPTGALLGIGGTAAGLYGLASTGPQNTNRSTAEMAQMAEMYGSSTGFEPGMGSYAQQEGRLSFERSTDGLTFGLHRGRHR